MNGRTAPEPYTGPSLFDLGLPDAGRDVAAVAHDAPDTSRAAAEQTLPRTGSRRARILTLLEAADLTDDELERRLLATHQSVSAARRGLVLDGWVEATGDTRPTRTGSAAQVWRLTPAARRAIADREVRP